MKPVSSGASRRTVHQTGTGSRPVRKVISASQKHSSKRSSSFIAGAIVSASTAYRLASGSGGSNATASAFSSASGRVTIAWRARKE